MTVKVLSDQDTDQGIWIAPYRVPPNGDTCCSVSGCPTGRWNPAMGNLGSRYVAVQAMVHQKVENRSPASGQRTYLDISRSEW